MAMLRMPRGMHMSHEHRRKIVSAKGIRFGQESASGSPIVVMSMHG